MLESQPDSRIKNRQPLRTRQANAATPRPTLSVGVYPSLDEVTALPEADMEEKKD